MGVDLSVTRHFVPMFLGLHSILFGCGTPETPSLANGFWSDSTSGGIGIVIYGGIGADAGTGWDPHYIDLLDVRFGEGCATYEVTADSGVVLLDGGLPVDGRNVEPGSALTLQWDLSGYAGLDARYRSLYPDASIAGTVTAIFSGSASLQGSDTLNVKWHVDYNDSSGTLSSEDQQIMCFRDATCPPP
jgi:hypothetical protein